MRLNLESEDILNEVEQKFKELKKKSIKSHNVSANNSNDNLLVSIDEVRKYIINNFSLSLLLEEERGMLREMLECAVKENKSDAVLLLICNQANYKGCNLKKEEDEKLLKLVPEGMAFLEIKHLYEGILKTNNLPEILGLPVLSLEEIKTIFSDESIMSKVVECILTQEKKLEIIIPKDKLDELDEYCTKMKRKKEKKMLERNKTGLSENDLKELGKYCDEVREEKTQKIKASLVHKNIKQILETGYPFHIVLYYKLKTKKSKLEKVENASKIVKELELSLQQSIATAGGEPFFKELQEIDKNENRLSKSLFKELCELGKDIPSNAVSFKGLIDNIMSSNEEYIASKREKEQEGKLENATVEVFEENINRGLKIRDLEDKLEESNTQNQSMATRLTSAESKAEQERAAREEAEAEKRAITIILEEAERREIFLKDAKEFFIAQFKLVVLYENVKNKFHDEAHKCVQLRKELTECEVIVDCAAQNPEEMSKEDIFERKLSLINELEKLNNKITKLDEESAKEKPTFENEKIEEFKRDVLAKVAKAKGDAKHFEQMLQQELEKLQRVEEEKLQMQVEEIPGSNISAAKVQPHQTIASKIA
ncbi:MAG: hypothetical protein U0X86_001123 [Wolbachia endosymbiont of Xenopsylla cheopis]